MYLRYWFGQLRSSVFLLLVLSSLVLTSGCGVNPLNLLTGGGPNVAANVQVGKTNTQTIGQTNNIAPTVSVRPNAKVDSIDQSNTTVNEGFTIWEVFVIGLFMGFLIPSHYEIARKIRNLWNKKAPAS